MKSKISSIKSYLIHLPFVCLTFLVMLLINVGLTAVSFPEYFITRYFTHLFLSCHVFIFWEINKWNENKYCLMHIKMILWKRADTGSLFWFREHLVILKIITEGFPFQSTESHVDSMTCFRSKQLSKLKTHIFCVAFLRNVS